MIFCKLRFSQLTFQEQKWTTELGEWKKDTETKIFTIQVRQFRQNGDSLTI